MSVIRPICSLPSPPPTSLLDMGRQGQGHVGQAEASVGAASWKLLELTGWWMKAIPWSTVGMQQMEGAWGCMKVSRVPEVLGRGPSETVGGGSLATVMEWEAGTMRHLWVPVNRTSE